MGQLETNNLRELERILRSAGISVGPHIPGVTRIGDAPLHITLGALKALNDESYRRGVDETINACLKVLATNRVAMFSPALRLAELVREELKKHPAPLTRGD